MVTEKTGTAFAVTILSMLLKSIKNTEEKWLLPFCIIEDATTGNVMAINTVMKHYEGYIEKLATRKMYDEYGNVHYCVDKTLRDRLEAKLLKTILEFKIVR